MAGSIVKNLLKENSPEQVAVVLPDERMLLPVMHSLPSEADRINITMGYPLSQTSLRTLLETWFTLQKQRKQNDDGSVYYHKQVKDILTHPYITALEKTDCEILHKKLVEEQYILVPTKVLLQENAPPYRKIIFSEMLFVIDLFFSKKKLNI